MHEFCELISNAARSSLSAFSIANQSINLSFEQSAATPLVKGLQIIQWQKAILATGLFSLYEAELQSELSCMNGFKECKRILIEEKKYNLCDRFQVFILAINVLKHGKGSSYNQLLKNYDVLPFNMKRINESFFYQGDISEISILIEVDDDFIINCVNLISEISTFLKNRT